MGDSLKQAVPPEHVLVGKTILLISPQPWDHILISKHHYAEELARENLVYFLEPPQGGHSFGFAMNVVERCRGLNIVSWRTSFPRLLRFHAYSLYRRLIAIDAGRITKKMGRFPDIVWSFDFNLFPDLAAFGAPLRIFHPVDPLTSDRQRQIGLSADLIVSVSDRILANFADAAFSGRTLLVNHGLARSFEKLADQPTISGPTNERHIGYFGNLDRRFINVALLRRLIVEHGNMIFHFWGPYAEEGNFYSAVGGLANVRLHGRLGKDELTKEIATMDCFLLPYNEDPIEYDRSNSHKLLEYMSTGKVTVSCRLDCYADRPDLIVMPDSDTDDAFFKAFQVAMDNIDSLNSSIASTRRKAFAKSFTYDANIRKIDAMLYSRIARPIFAEDAAS